MQVTEIGLGASASDAGTWKTQYEYGELQSNGTVDTTKNTGNIAKQTLSFNGITHPLVQSYKYDPLYRITEATETANSVANWFQVLGYDRYGNRTSFTQNIGGNPASVNPTIVTATNRFDETGTNFDYDLNGNLVRDADGKQFTFNGDNKQTVVKDANNNVIGRYYYDGEGKRVKKITNAETTIFVYSSGKLVAEYSTQISTSPSISYTTTDHLGSPRVITDGIGQVSSRRDFLPFGEDLLVGVGSRTSANRYSSTTDSIRQKFTGYQKDTETSLDFAEARMYDNRFGRFTAVDPLLASGTAAVPQSFNRYVYCNDNPLNAYDPDGKKPVWIYRYNKQTKRNQYLGIDSRDLKLYTKGKNKWSLLQTKNLPYSYMSVNGYPVTLLDGHRMILHKSLVPNFDDRNNPIEGYDAAGGLVYSYTGGLINFGNENNPTWQNAKGGADIVQYASLVKTLATMGVVATAGAIWGIVKMTAKNSGDIAKIAGVVLKDFKVFECVKAANALEAVYKAKGVSGQVIQLGTKGGDAIDIVSDTYGTSQAISRNGIHQAVRIGDTVYDNIHKNGISYTDWLKDFSSRDNLVVKVLREF